MTRSPIFDHCSTDQHVDNRLAEVDERKSWVVELHYFGGLTYEETAAALGISPATVDRDLRMAGAWLYREMS